MDSPLYMKIGTVSGRLLDPSAPDPAQIEIGDIAHGLSNICRFAGQCREFYSVAQHSVLVSLALEKEPGATVEDLRWGLLHDAAEAYTGDIPSPVKRLLNAFDEIEAAILWAVASRFKLSPESPPAIVLEVDRAALDIEIPALMPSKSSRWCGERARFGAWPSVLRPQRPETARNLFMQRAADLGLDGAQDQTPPPADEPNPADRPGAPRGKT